MKRKVIALVAAAVCAALCSAVPATASATSWRVQAVPKPSGSVLARLFSVSCPARGNCTAVGFSSAKPVTTGGSTLAEHWNGTSWAIQRIPLPAGAYEAELTGVACPGATQCVAVGHYNDLTTGGVPFAAWWNGTGWTVQATSGPATGDPNAVSCTSQTACTAVGNGTQPLVAWRWNGTTWTSQTVPSAVPTELIGVSCPSATSCTAVGDESYGSSTHIGVAAHWNGTNWVTQQTPPVPKSAGSAGLFGASCRSATYCTAVGWHNTRQPLAVHEN